MDRVHKETRATRSKIDLHDNDAVKYWSRQLGVSKRRIQEAVEKVGNSAAAVRKELRHAIT